MVTVMKALTVIPVFNIIFDIGSDIPADLCLFKISNENSGIMYKVQN